MPYLLSFCVNAPKHQRCLNSNLVDTTPPIQLNGLSVNVVGLFLNPVVHYSFIFSVTAPKRLHQLNSKFIIATPPQPFK